MYRTPHLFSGAGRIASRAAAILLLIAASATGSLRAQTGGQAPAPRQHRITLSVIAGPTGTNVSKGLQQALVEQGFTDTFYCFIFCFSTEPGRAHRGAAALVEVRMDLRAHLAIAATAGAGDVATANAFRDDDVYDDFNGETVNLQLGVRMYAATAILGNEYLHIEAGPAVYRVSSGDYWEDTTHDSAVKIGALTGVGGELRVFQGMVVEARVQYRFVGKHEIGPYGGFRPTTLDYSHRFIGLGVGYRF